MNESKDILIEVADGIHLSPVSHTDKAAYMEHFTDPEIARNLLAIPFPFTEADADWWINRCEQSATSPLTRLAIRESTGYLIGGIGVVGAWSLGEHRAEFGYWLAKSYRGHGLMPRVIGAFSAYLFEECRVHRLYATPFSSNHASHRALEKAGFQREGLLKHYHLKQGDYIDAVIYGRISEAASFANVTITPDDAGGATAQELIQALCAELSKRYDNPPSPFSPSDASAPRTVFLVARLDGEPVGCGALRRIDDITAEIKRMYVAPSGRRRGIARRILAELERTALGFGYQVLRLETGIYQEEAIGLYESCGYHRIPAFGHYIGSAISVCYEKLLERLSESIEST